jgi:multisubunit Na+/H+ antiporter MnhG subunit
MSFVALVVGILTSLLLVAASLAFLKAKDVFTMTYVVMASNCYILPLLLLAVEIDRFSWISLTKILALIILNLVVVNLLCHVILRRAIINKITPDAKFVDGGSF